MNKDNDMRSDSREQRSGAQTGSGINANANDPDTRSHGSDNSGMHAGGSRGSSYRRPQQPENPRQYGSKKGSYWEERGSDREQSVGSRMNQQSLNQKK